MNCLLVGLLLSLVSTVPIAPAVGPPVLATQFSAVGDPWNPNPELACRPGRDLDDKHDVVVAHRTLPCGTRVKVCVVRSGACVVARVADRLGRCSHGRCSQLDLAPATARLLRHSRRRGWNGMELVTVQQVAPVVAAPRPQTVSLWQSLAGGAGGDTVASGISGALQRLACNADPTVPGAALSMNSLANASR